MSECQYNFLLPAFPASLDENMSKAPREFTGFLSFRLGEQFQFMLRNPIAIEAFKAYKNSIVQNIQFLNSQNKQSFNLFYI